MIKISKSASWFLPVNPITGRIKIINFVALNVKLIIMQKDRLEGIDLQVSAIFARLDALKQALPKESLEKYNQFIEQKKLYYRENFLVRDEQVEEWLQ